MSRITKYLVVTIGGVSTSGKADRRWHDRREDAKADVKRRLQLRRLQEGKRLDATEWPLEERALTHDGFEWRCVAIMHYDRFPPSHPDHRRGGGVRLYSMDRESPPFDPSTIKFG